MVGIYLFYEVRAVRAPASAPTVEVDPARESEPEREHRSRSNVGLGSRSQRSAANPDDPDRAQPNLASAPEPPGGEEDDPNRANPSLDAIMDRANKAYDRGDLDEARAIATGVLARSPTNVRMMRIVVSAACMEGDVDIAQQWYDKLPGFDREQMKTRCARYGASFREPGQ